MKSTAKLPAYGCRIVVCGPWASYDIKQGTLQIHLTRYRTFELLRCYSTLCHRNPIKI